LEYIDQLLIYFSRFDDVFDQLQGDDVGAISVALPIVETNSTNISAAEIVLLVICALIICTAFATAFVLMKYWNRYVDYKQLYYYLWRPELGTGTGFRDGITWDLKS
jgi:uncharacterized membrane protein